MTHGIQSSEEAKRACPLSLVRVAVSGPSGSDTKVLQWNLDIVRGCVVSKPVSLASLPEIWEPLNILSFLPCSNLPRVDSLVCN